MKSEFARFWYSVWLGLRTIWVFVLIGINPNQKHLEALRRIAGEFVALGILERYGAGGD